MNEVRRLVLMSVVYRDVLERFVKYREQRNISQNELAQMLCISQSYVSKMEISSLKIIYESHNWVVLNYTDSSAYFGITLHNFSFIWAKFWASVSAYMRCNTRHSHFINTVVLFTDMLKIFLPMQSHHRHLIFIQK